MTSSNSRQVPLQLPLVSVRGNQIDYRVSGDNVRVNNFGILKFDWEQSQVIGEIRDQNGVPLRTAKVPIAN